MYFLGKGLLLDKEVSRMADNKLQQKLVDYVEDAHAMEQNVSRMLDSMMTTTDDPEITEILRHHKEETERHEQRLRERLDALGAGTSTRKQAQTIATALMKGRPTRCAETKPARTQETATSANTWR